jgi:DNA-binding cell septation regulator SpoVG
MTIEILSINPPRLGSALASAKIRLKLEEGHAIDIDDIRVLRNSRGELWTALPTHSVKNNREYRYEKTVDCSRGLWRKIDDAVQDAYAKWNEASHGQAVRP